MWCYANKEGYPEVSASLSNPSSQIHWESCSDPNVNKRDMSLKLANRGNAWEHFTLVDDDNAL